MGIVCQGDSDQALVAAALRDRHAYARIVLRYEAPLGRYVRRLLGSSAQATEDVLQETFVKAYINLNDYDPARPFSAWLYRIAHNQAVDVLRRKGGQPQVITGEDGQTILEQLADMGDVNEGIDVSRQEAAMLHALTTLSAHYREVLILRFLEDKSYDDIAEILHLPMGTVATRIRRGLAQLKAAVLYAVGAQS